MEGVSVQEANVQAQATGAQQRNADGWGWLGTHCKSLSVKASLQLRRGTHLC